MLSPWCLLSDRDLTTWGTHGTGGQTDTAQPHHHLICALGQHRLVTVLRRCGLALSVYILADEKHSHCLKEKVYLPTIVRGRVIWHLGYTEHANAAAFTKSYGEFQLCPTFYTWRFEQGCAA